MAENNKIFITPHKGIVFGTHTINVGDEISAVVNQVKPTEVYRGNEYYFTDDNVIHVVADKKRVAEIELFNSEDYKFFIDDTLISAMEREELTEYLTKMNKAMPIAEYDLSLDFTNLGISLWYERTLEDVLEVIEEAKSEGDFTDEDAEIEMRLAKYFASIIIH